MNFEKLTNLNMDMQGLTEQRDYISDDSKHSLSACVTETNIASCKTQSLTGDLSWSTNSNQATQSQRDSSNPAEISRALSTVNTKFI